MIGAPLDSSSRSLDPVFIGDEHYAVAQETKRILQKQFDWDSAEMWEKQGAISGPVFASEDAKEGAAAFKEKREPVWNGR